MILTRSHHDVYSITKKVSQLKTLMMKLLIFLLITIIVFNSNLSSLLLAAWQTENGRTKDVEIMVPLKYLDNFWRILEILLINCEISLQLKWSKFCIVEAGTVANENTSFQINDTKLYASFVTLSSQEKMKLLKQLESGFKRTIYWNTYL